MDRLGEAEWEDVYCRIAEDLSQKIIRTYYQGVVENMLKLSTPAEKLVFFYLALFQPQTFVTLRKGLGLYETTLLRALNGLRSKGVIRLGKDYLWWISID